MTDAAPADAHEKSFRRVKRFYSIATEREWERLAQPHEGALEFAVNRAWIERYLPPAGSSVLDLGGGPGRYAIWLAGLGHRVTLADLSPDLLALAREKAAEASVKLEDAVETNAVDLACFADDSFEAALCMGPLYHLIHEDDRRRAARELFRVVRPGGRVFVAFLNRLQVLRNAINPDIPFFTPYTFDIVKRWHYEGILDMPIAGTFNLAYLFHPREVTPFMEAAGFRTLNLVSSQSVAADVQKHLASFKERQPELYDWVLAELIKLADDESALGSSWHLLYIGEKP